MLDRYAVFGFPVAHSQSPFIHQAFAEQTGQRLVYDRRECPPDAFADALRAWVDQPAEAAHLGPVRGCNVTMPFKFDALRLARQASDRAVLAGAANVLNFDTPGWSADNTDGAGLVQDLRDHEGLVLQGLHILLIGAGGAAAGVLGPLLDEGPQRLVVSNRTHTKAEALVHRHAAVAAASLTDLQALSPERLAGAGTFDLVINASSTSLAGQAPPAPPQVLADGCCAVDLVYGPSARVFLDWALHHGAARAIDGLGMLVAQAALAFEGWRGVRPQTAPVLAALRARLASPGAH